MAAARSRRRYSAVILNTGATTKFSLAQASRVLARLVELGIVERRDVPPSSLFQLVRQHVAVGPLLALARARDALIGEMGRLAAGLPLVPVSVIVFGSFARGEADVDSDIDTGGLPRLDLDDIPAIADFIAAELGL